MSIQSEITRLNTAKADIITAIEGKGVTVADGAAIDDLPGYVGQIQTGTQLPALTNPASAAEIHEGYEAIDGSGSVLTGTFNLGTELAAQDSLITQIQTALEGKASGGGSGGSQNQIEITFPSAVSAVIAYADAETNTAVSGRPNAGSTIKPLGGAICVMGKTVSSATCNYVTCSPRSGYYMYVFLSSGEVTL